MYERFTDRARKIMQLANQEAQRFRHEYIGTEHILLGLVEEGTGVGAHVLKNLGVDLRKVRREVEQIVLSGPEVRDVDDNLPRTPRAKAVIQGAMEEARNLNHNYVGSEHVLLGLLREQEGVAAQVLMNLGLTLERVRKEVLNLLGCGERPGVSLGQAATSSLHELARVHGGDPRIKALLEQIGALNQEKEKAVADEDYERAILLRDRLKELRSRLEGLLMSIASEKKSDRESGNGHDA